jgi:hypothetical protein
VAVQHGATDRIQLLGRQTRSNRLAHGLERLGRNSTNGT